MGSATRQASETARAALADQSGQAALATGGELLTAGRIIGDSAQLRSMLADPSVTDADKRAVLGSLSASFGAPTRAVLDAVATSRWSSHDDLLAGIEELGFSAIAASAD